MKILFYDKNTDRYLEGTIVEAKVKRDDEIINVHGDNVKYIKVPGKCMACGKDDDWKLNEMIIGAVIYLVGISIVVIAVTHVIGLFK